MVQQSANLLVVDDDSFIRDMLADRLSFRGYNVVTATNGVEALDIIAQHPLDLIFLDIMMPEIDGFQVLEHLREVENPVPVIVMSALNDLESIVRCIELGAEDYLYKPIQNQLLWARLQASLQKKRLMDRDKARMVELRLLQQIDEQLNKTLDHREIAQLTLQWSLEIAHAEAGCMGHAQGKSLRLWARQGLPDDMTEMLDLSLLGIDSRWLAEANVVQTKIASSALSPSAAYRVLLPIHREQHIEALLVLEMSEPCSPETLEFLTRLEKHAAIALNNARLYSEVQAASQAKSNFVAMVSHELKNPLHAIQSYIHLLQRSTNGSLKTQEKKFLEIIKTSAGRIHNLTLELDDIARMEVDEFTLSSTAVSLPQVIKEVLDTLAQKQEAKEQRLIIDVDDTLTPVWADPQRLNQILTNLLSNAIKYTPPQGTITIQAKRQEPADGGQPGLTRVVVRDTGLGIAPEDQDKLFSPFFRSADRMVRAEKGTGLGLHIARKLVELHGGTISFESEYGTGTAFYFTLPVAQSDPSVTPDETAGPA